jgi:hypothetical protein
MARLRCDFTFLRRTFRREVAMRDAPEELHRIAVYWQELLAREEDEVRHDHEQLLTLAAAHA